MITFTGSPEVGWGIKGRAPRKKVGLELGNNAPVIVEPDADLELAATKIVAGGYAYSGQTCIAVQRVLVHHSVRDELVGQIVPKVEALVVGNPLDDATDVSALIAPSERDRIVGWVEEAIDGGAKVATGGKVAGDVLTPTVLTNVTPDMKVCSEEVFGPLIGVQGYDSFDEAIALANDSRYGLQAAVFTRDLSTGLRAAHELDFGGRDGQRDADLPHRPDAVRRGEGQRQHQGRSALRGPRDDRGAPRRHPALTVPARTTT